MEHIWEINLKLPEHMKAAGFYMLFLRKGTTKQQHKTLRKYGIIKCLQ